VEALKECDYRPDQGAGKRVELLGSVEAMISKKYISGEKRPNPKARKKMLKRKMNL
jgi:hypothetical protein